MLDIGALLLFQALISEYFIWLLAPICTLFKGWSEKISLIAIFTMVSIIPQLDYYPKLFFIVLLGTLAYTLKTPNRLPK